MQTQATRCTQKQLAYLAFWQAKGYHFPRDAVIPESTLTPPAEWHLPRWVDLAASAWMLASMFAIPKVAA